MFWSNLSLEWSWPNPHNYDGKIVFKASLEIDVKLSIMSKTEWKLQGSAVGVFTFFTYSKSAAICERILKSDSLKLHFLCRTMCWLYVQFKIVPTTLHGYDVCGACLDQGCVARREYLYRFLKPKGGLSCQYTSFSAYKCQTIKEGLRCSIIYLRWYLPIFNKALSERQSLLTLFAYVRPRILLYLGRVLSNMFLLQPSYKAGGMVWRCTLCHATISP